MFHLPDDPTPYRVIGIDPGTDTLGVSVLDLDLMTGAIALADSQTLVGSSMLRVRQPVVDVYGPRFARLQGLEEALVDHFQHYGPHAVICESPFYNPRRPGAFQALVEAMSMIERAVYQYAPNLPLRKIDPASAKARLGVSGKSGDKELVKRAVMSCPDVANPYQIRLADLDEHSIDSILIGYYHATDIKAQLVL